MDFPPPQVVGRCLACCADWWLFHELGEQGCGTPGCPGESDPAERQRPESEAA